VEIAYKFNLLIFQHFIQWSLLSDFRSYLLSSIKTNHKHVQIRVYYGLLLYERLLSFRSFPFYFIMIDYFQLQLLTTLETWFLSWTHRVVERLEFLGQWRLYLIMGQVWEAHLILNSFGWLFDSFVNALYLQWWFDFDWKLRWSCFWWCCWY